METLPMLAIPVLVLLSPVLLAALVLRHRRARAALRYQFLLKLVEAGASLPASLPGEATLPPCDRRRGLVLCAGGLGLSATLVTLPLHYHLGHPVAELWGLGILPMALGLGYLGSWYLTRRGSARG